MNQQLQKRGDPIRQAYLEVQKDVGNLLPAEIPPKRFLALVADCINQNDQLLDCEPRSFIFAVRQAAELGLLPGTSALAACHLIPRRDHGVWKAQFMLGYRGGEELCERKGWHVDSRVVYEGDRFSYQLGTKPSVSHRPRRHKGENPQVRATYAVLWEKKTRQVIDLEVLEREDIERRRQLSVAAEGNWWRDFYPMMARKSAVRALMMRQPLAPFGATLQKAGIEVEPPAPEEMGEGDPTRPEDAELVDDPTGGKALAEGERSGVAAGAEPPPEQSDERASGGGPEPSAVTPRPAHAAARNPVEAKGIHAREGASGSPHEPFERDEPATTREAIQMIYMRCQRMGIDPQALLEAVTGKQRVTDLTGGEMADAIEATDAIWNKRKDLVRYRDKWTLVDADQPEQTELPSQ